MSEFNRTNFSKWIAKQFRLSGEELIRRSEMMDFTGWDGITDIQVSFNIPTYTDDIEAPGFDITFSCINKKAVDDLIASSRCVRHPVTEEGILKPFTNAQICPKCGKELQRLGNYADPPQYRLVCPFCGWTKEEAQEWQR